LDYRIIHNAAVALTHKSQPGTYQAFAIDIGCYAHLRKLDGRFTELDLAGGDAKEKMRSAPVLDANEFETLWGSIPSLSFLEKHKDRLPDTYNRAVKLSENSGVLVNRQDDAMARLYQGWSMEETASAMKQLLSGIAAGQVDAK